MPEPTSNPGNAAREQLVERLDAIIAAVEAGSYDPARQALFVGRWTQEIESEDLPEELLANAISTTDAAHAALSRWPPDTETAKALLQTARELIV